jgi:hypothetical protein
LVYLSARLTASAGSEISLAGKEGAQQAIGLLRL